MMESVLLLASIAFFSLESVAGMMQAGGIEPVRNEEGTRNLNIEFQDHFFVQGKLKPADNEPAWVTQPPLDPFVFDRYLMYVVIYIQRGRVHTFEAEAHAPLYGKVQNYHQHIPSQIVLAASGQGDQDAFSAQEIKPYTNYGQLELLRIPSKTHRHFGYVFIAVRGTGNCYVGKLFLNHITQRQTGEHVGPSVSAPESSGPNDASHQYLI